MRLYISGFFVRDRESGVVGPMPLDGDTLAFFGSVAAGQYPASIPAAHTAIRAGTPEGAALRVKYSEAVLMLDNQARASYQFPAATAADTAKLQADLVAANAELAAATTVAATANSRVAEAQQAETRRKAALARVATLHSRLASGTPAPVPTIETGTVTATDPAHAAALKRAGLRVANAPAAAAPAATASAPVNTSATAQPAESAGGGVETSSAGASGSAAAPAPVAGVKSAADALRRKPAQAPAAPAPAAPADAAPVDPAPVIPEIPEDVEPGTPPA